MNENNSVPVTHKVNARELLGYFEAFGGIDGLCAMFGFDAPPWLRAVVQALGNGERIQVRATFRGVTYDIEVSS